MRNILSLGLSVITLQVAAQITIVSSDLPKSGDTLRYSSAPITSQVNVKIKGANQVWDFSNLTPNSQGVIKYKPTPQINPIYVVPFGITSFGEKTYDSLNLGPIKMKDGYQFYKNATASFSNYGQGFSVSGIPVPMKYSDIDEIYQFPLDYLDKDVSTFYGKSAIPNTFTYITKGGRTTEVEGWGKVITPYGTFNDCLKLRIAYKKTDTIITPSAPFPIVNTTDEVHYVWLAKGEKLPVMEIKGREIFTFFTVSQIRYKDKIRDIDQFYEPSVDFSADKVLCGIADSVNLINHSTGPFFLQNKYKWELSPATYSFVANTTDSSKDPIVMFSDTGLYTVKLTATNSFSSDAEVKMDYIHVVQTVGITELKQAANIGFYPNPIKAGNMLSIRNPLDGVLTVYTADGRIAYQQRINAQTVSVKLPTTLTAGIYLMQIQSESQIGSQYLVVQP